MGAPSPIARFQEADAATRDAGAGKDADDADDSPRFEVEFDDDDDVTTTAAAEARTPGGGHALFESLRRVPVAAAGGPRPVHRRGGRGDAGPGLRGEARGL